MDLNLLAGHCAHCGASLRAGLDECPSCHQPSQDPAVRDLAAQIDANGVTALQAAGVAALCNDVAGATLLLRYVAGDDPALAQAAAGVLKGLTDRAALREMVSLVGTGRWLGQPQEGTHPDPAHPNPALFAAVRSVFSTDDALHRELLLEAIRNVNNGVREAAADLLQFQSGPEVRDALIKAMRGDSDPVVRARAAVALGCLGDTGALDDLIQALRDDSSLVQSKAAQALGRLGQGVVPAAVHELTTGSPAAALHSARLLAQLGTPQAVQALINVLWNRDAGPKEGLARLYAEQALAQMGTHVLPPLMRALIQHSDSVNIRDGIAYVLRTMRMTAQERMIVQPVIDAAERFRYSSAAETTAAAYQVLGVLEGVTPEELRRRLEAI